MKFVKVINRIVEITSKQVVFHNTSFANATETFLNRVHQKKVIWKLKEDGIYVRNCIAVAYNLTTV